MNKILILLLISAPLCAMNKPKAFRRIKAWTHESYENARKEIKKQELEDAIMLKQTKRGIRHRKIERKNNYQLKEY